MLQWPPGATHKAPPAELNEALTRIIRHEPDDLLALNYSGAFRRSMQETEMAKGQMKSNKETKKPKADKDKPKVGASAYKLGQGKGEAAASPFTKKS